MPTPLGTLERRCEHPTVCLLSHTSQWEKQAPNHRTGAVEQVAVQKERDRARVWVPWAGGRVPQGRAWEDWRALEGGRCPPSGGCQGRFSSGSVGPVWLGVEKRPCRDTRVRTLRGHTVCFVCA